MVAAASTEIAVLGRSVMLLVVHMVIHTLCLVKDTGRGCAPRAHDDRKALSPRPVMSTGAGMAHGGRPARMKRAGTFFLAAVSSFLLAEPSGAQGQKLDKDDLAVVMGAYVDGVAGLNRLLIACAPIKPVHWEEGAAMLGATLRAAGFQESETAALVARLTGDHGLPTSNCTNDVVEKRLSIEVAADWVEFHRMALANIGVEIVMAEPEPDARLAAVRAIFARQIPEQARMLNCMALVQPGWFPTAYADWEGVLDKAATSLRQANYSNELVASLVDPARARRLMAPAVDRQAAIADCAGETEWLQRYAMFDWYLASDVDKALGAAP